MTEFIKAKAWRERMGLTMDQLARLTGYSKASISWFEKGETPPRTYAGKKSKSKRGTQIGESVWTRYKRACHSCQVQLERKEQFKW